MDTWATSSLSPQIATGWVDDPDLFARTFPMDLRPQAHDIIRTWLFYTVVRSHYEHDVAAVGQRRHLGLHRRPRPQEAVEVGGQRARRPRRADRHATAPTACATGPPTAARAWTSCSTRASSRSAASWPSSCSTRRSSPWGSGRRRPERSPSRSTGRCWRRWPTSSPRPPPPSTASTTPGRSSAPRPSSGRSATTTSSWSRTGPTAPTATTGAASARTALGLALRTLLGLFAPFLPFVTEEVWSWWQEGSVHRSSWPSADALREAAGADDAASPGDEPDPAVLAVAAAVLGEVRKAKSEAKRSMRTEVTAVVVTDTPERLALLALAADDVRSAGRIATLDHGPGRRVLGRRRARPRGLRRVSGRGGGSSPEVRGVSSSGGASSSSSPSTSWDEPASRRTHTERWGNGISMPSPRNASDRRRRSSRITGNWSPGRVLTTRRIDDGVGAHALDAPHLGRLEDAASPRGIARHTPSATRLDDLLRLVDVGAVGHLDVEQRPGPLLRHVADPVDRAVGDVPHGAARPSRMRVVRSVTASTVPVASPTSMMSPTPYWSSTSMKMPGQEVLHQALGAEAEGDARDAGAGDQRPQVHPQLAEDHRDGDGPDAARTRSTAAPGPASGRGRPTAATACPCRRWRWGPAS